ncbi:related to high-affinity phosphate permease,phosphate-repressible [Claviceps purpurea 20.1]|uniref:Related to high-affinity phosphate permease,phosphate-repressible n=1 Tax=Claviceps purpurea (strain 20.1) TaxID=1111077 RepID=M1WCU3_CLAP2|nr:related to high-affinity phosphate permease,phosphate-repressible [Claviceps purpurea 20.1]
MPPDTPVHRKNRGFLASDSSALPPQDQEDRKQLRYELDLNSWNFRIWVVAASGFLTDSYNLFSTNVILASVAFVYYPNGEPWPSLLINVFTLLGSVIGQLLFGFLADYYGRTRLYGIELVLVIVSTIGVATSSRGVGDLSFLGLFIWWRFVMGIEDVFVLGPGIGAEYPLSAVITSEWSSTQSRATMLSSVFLMQPVGQALAQLVGLWVLLGFDRSRKLQTLQCGLNTAHHEECRQAVDGIWRIVIGSGAVPALLAIIFRFFLFDCGLYSLEVRDKPAVAIRNTQRVYGTPLRAGGTRGLDNVFPMQTLNQNGNHLQTVMSPRSMPVQFSKQDLHDYFIRDGNWHYLFGTAMTWFLLDVSFYGLSLDNRRTLSDMWATSPPVPIDERLACWHSSIPGGTSTVPQWQVTGIPAWQTDVLHPCATIYHVLIVQAKQYLLTVSIASLAGSICFIVFANRLPRRHWLTASFLILAVFLLITGGVYYTVRRTAGAPATVVFVAIHHFVFNFGANTLTFIIPAEIFPTCYRCTCHGISAAAGKLGSILAVLVVYGINSAYESDSRQGLIFLLFGSVAAFGAVFSWLYLPDSQRVIEHEDSGKKFLETKNLEELGEGRERARRNGEVVTVRARWRDVRSRLRRSSLSASRDS